MVVYKFLKWFHNWRLRRTATVLQVVSDLILVSVSLRAAIERFDSARLDASGGGAIGNPPNSAHSLAVIASSVEVKDTSKAQHWRPKLDYQG